MPQSKLFTPERANQTLPLVRRIVKDILRIGQQVRSLSVEFEKFEENAEFNQWMDQLDELFAELEALGCSYKDWNFSVGLVDFPAVIRGKEVFLCWRSDEKELKYYHEADAGYVGRKLIPQNVCTSPK